MISVYVDLIFSVYLAIWVDGIKKCLMSKVTAAEISEERQVTVLSDTVQTEGVQSHRPAVCSEHTCCNSWSHRCETHTLLRHIPLCNRETLTQCRPDRLWVLASARHVSESRLDERWSLEITYTRHCVTTPTQPAAPHAKTNTWSSDEAAWERPVPFVSDVSETPFLTNDG